MYSILSFSRGSPQPRDQTCISRQMFLPVSYLGSPLEAVTLTQNAFQRLSDNYSNINCNMGFPGGSVGEESACDAGYLGSIPGWGRSPEEGSGNPLQCSCLKNPMHRGAWQVTVHGVTKSQTRLSN